MAPFYKCTHLLPFVLTHVLTYQVESSSAQSHFPPPHLTCESFPNLTCPLLDQYVAYNQYTLLTNLLAYSHTSILTILQFLKVGPRLEQFTCIHHVLQCMQTLHAPMHPYITCSNACIHHVLQCMHTSRTPMHAYITCFNACIHHVHSRWNLVWNNSYVIGDFIWTAIDYIGE